MLLLFIINVQTLTLNWSYSSYELAANIEDIFADHDVEIVAVDADDADFDSEDDEISDNLSKDDDTFVSARSMRSLRSQTRSVRSLVRGFESGTANKQQQPVLEITTKKKKERKSKPSKFDNYEEDDMMLQIEAMARQADVAFESRKKMSSTWDAAAGKNTPAIIMPAIDAVEGSKADRVNANTEIQEGDVDSSSTAKSALQASTSFDEERNIITPNNVLGTMKAMTKKGGADVSNTSSSQREALSRNFLNTSTSMVSTMVAASQGRVNEVHVLQYLGVTIVCIAANFMQHTRQAAGMQSPGGGGGGGHSFGPKEVFQSAMFLAFMVNGQRYLAKVTKKN